MKLWTYREVKQKVEADLDLMEETFITPDELVGYCNDAIHEAESEILKINEDYFLSQASLSLVQGQQTYSLPDGIYAQKIRSLQYVNGAINYAVRRIRGANKFDILTMVQQYGPNEDYQYLLVNNNPGTQNQILLAPPARESGPFITLWHIRTAKKVPTAADEGIEPTDPNTDGQLDTVLDIPEFTNFIMEFMKCKCLAKDTDPRFEMQVAAMEAQRKLMVDSLTQQVPDDDDTVVPDLSFYRDFS